jgi:preprotein translocase subunit SecE
VQFKGLAHGTSAEVGLRTPGPVNSNGCSSIGRVAVSKTVGWEFESLHPCKAKKSMEKLKIYILDSIDEIRNKVYWPKFNELQSSAVLVLVASLIFAIVIGAVDLAFQNGLAWFYTLN